MVRQACSVSLPRSCSEFSCVVFSGEKSVWPRSANPERAAVHLDPRDGDERHGADEREHADPDRAADAYAAR